MEVGYEVPSSVLVIFFVVNMIAIFMLSEVKREHQNKLGSYQEIAYFYT